MAIALQIAAKGVDGQIDAGEGTFFCRPLFDDVGGEEREAIEEVTIHPEERLKAGRDRPGNMLPYGIW